MTNTPQQEAKTMIDPRELRIGNLVETAGDYIQVCPEDFKDTTHLFSIPLTEEWLIKFGFEKCIFPSGKERKFCYQNKRRTLLMMGENTFRDYISFYDLRDNTFASIYCLNVHQLQNVYFALTGKELEINQ